FATLASAPHGIDLGPLRPNLLQRLETASGCIECAPPLLLADLERLAASLTDVPAREALQLIGRRELRSNNSWMHNAPRLVKGRARHQLWMHPDDLAARSIVDGARVRVRSAAGEITIEAQAHEGMMPGVACLPHGYGHDRDGVRLLSGDITQRARAAQFDAAAAFVRRCKVRRCVAIPGNHDIPLFNVVGRAFQPYAGFCRAFGPRLEQVVELPDMLVIALNTT